MNAVARNAAFGATIYSRNDAGFTATERAYEADTLIPMHRHRDAYIALVLDGGYDEIGMEGSCPGKCGTAIYHPPFHAHSDHIDKPGARILDISVDGCASAVTLGSRAFLIQHGVLNAISLLAERDARGAYFGVMEEFETAEPLEDEDQLSWLDDTRNTLTATPSARLGAAAYLAGRSPDYISRTLKARFGFGASALKGEARLRRAIAGLASRTMTLCEAALMAGYADQAHMTRELKRRTDLTPGQIRRYLDRGFVQDA